MNQSSQARLNFNVQRIVAIVAVILFVFKIVAWWMTKSVAVLTDALESTVNVVAGFISLYSLYVAAKPRDKEHPYGHGKAEFVSAAVEGSLVSIAGLVIIYEAIDNFIHPHEIQKLDTGMIIIGFTALINYATGWYAIRVGKKNNSLALVASGKHLQSDTYSTIGIVAAMAVIFFTGWIWMDSLIAIGFAFFIIYTGYTIVRSSIAGIMDEADHALLEKLVGRMNENRRENWVDLHNLRIIKFGTVIHVDCHLTVPWFLNVHEAHNEVDAFSEIARNEFGESVELFVHADGCLDFSCKICNKSECPQRKSKFEKRIEWDVHNISSDEKHGLVI
ncbi:MAG: cation diffusion facilitator family transporter [Chitinophagaceae bacterium]